MAFDPFTTPAGYEDDDEYWRDLVLRPGDEDQYGPERELWEDRQAAYAPLSRLPLGAGWKL